MESKLLSFPIGFGLHFSVGLNKDLSLPESRKRLILLGLIKPHKFRVNALARGKTAGLLVLFMQFRITKFYMR